MSEVISDPFVLNAQLDLLSMPTLGVNQLIQPVLRHNIKQAVYVQTVQVDAQPVMVKDVSHVLMLIKSEN